jgi:hypothetical protein
MDRSADNHYPTSDLEVIAARDFAADNCALFLWATVPMLPQALYVMDEWGFRYKSQVVWVKGRIVTIMKAQELAAAPMLPCRLVVQFDRCEASTTDSFSHGKFSRLTGACDPEYREPDVVIPWNQFVPLMEAFDGR